MDNDKRFFSINLRLSKIGILIAVVTVALWLGGFYYLTEKPHYITLEPSFPHGVFTRIEEKSIITWYNGLPGSAESNSYVWRKYFLIGFDCCSNLKNQAQILKYLDDWLVSEGWVRWAEIGDPCAHMTEANFLERGKDFFPYVPKGTTSLMDTPAVCVAVWAADSKSEFYWVLLATTNK